MAKEKIHEGKMLKYFREEVMRISAKKLSAILGCTAQSIYENQRMPEMYEKFKEKLARKKINWQSLPEEPEELTIWKEKAEYWEKKYHDLSEEMLEVQRVCIGLMSKK